MNLATLDTVPISCYGSTNRSSGKHQDMRNLVKKLTLLVCFAFAYSPSIDAEELKVSKPLLQAIPLESGKFYKLTVSTQEAKRVRFYMLRTFAGVKEKRQIKQDTDASDGFAVIWRPRGLYGFVQLFAVVELPNGEKIESDKVSLIISTRGERKKH